MRMVKYLLALFITLPIFIATPVVADNASIYFSPTAGQFRVGSTIDISIVINTGSHSINALSTNISFPADKLQVISPSVGTSFISIWTNVPSYSNTDGTLTFAGGIPNPGMKSSSAVLSTIKFRVISAGKAVLKFNDGTKILANDGIGTDVLSSKTSAILVLENAPPDGPVVTSSTHPDQNVWYNDNASSFSWEDIKDASNYSFAIDSSAKTIPGEESTTPKISTTQSVEGDGIWYFHIRAFANDIWGGTTHYLFRIDSTGPAEFVIDIENNTIRSGDRAIINFLTTDAASGIDRYEIKIINTSKNNTDISLFHEESSPYQLPLLDADDYKIIVRAIDYAGNHTDSTINLRVTKSGLSIISFISTPLGAAVGLGLLIMLGILVALFARSRRKSERKIEDTQNINPPPPVYKEN